MVGDAMRKRALRKDFYMEIRRSLNRFLSIFFIVALGVAFYSGIQSSAPDMEDTGDTYFDKYQLMDLKVVSTMGLTEEDVEVLLELESVEKAEGAYMTDVLYGEEAGQKVLHVESITENFQKLQAEQGELPSSADECFLDTRAAESLGIQLGDTITLREDGEEEDHVLKTRNFKVSGIGASSAYVSFGRGNTTLGSGEVTGFCYVLPEAFDMEVYVQIFLAVKGAEDTTAFTDSYDEVVDKARDQVKGIEDVRCQARYDEITGEAQEKIDDARQELEDGKKEAEEKLADAQAEIEDGEKQLQEGKDQLEQGKKDLEDAKKKVADGKAELEEKEKELSDARQQVEDGWVQLNSGKQTLADSESQYNSQKASTEEQINTGEIALAAAQLQYDQGMAQYEDGLTQVNEAYVQLELKENMLSQQAQLSEEGQVMYEAAMPEIKAARSELDAKSTQLAESKASLDKAKEQIDSQSAQLQSARSELEAAGNQIEAARQEISSKEAQLLEAQAQVDDGQAKIDEGWEELKDGEQEIADAEADIEEAEKTIQENEQKLKDGRADYEDAQKEVDDTIADGEKKIEDAQKELDDLDMPEWTVYDRDDLPDYTGYGQNADRMRNLGEVFPVLFFLVAALVSLTTMTRMVEEERTQIGTLKALGYGKASIAFKYIGYAFLATVGGSVFGVLIGEKILPFVIIYAYGIMYQHVDVMVLDYRMDQGLMASLVSLFCTMAGTLSACIKELAAMPASLMRPPAPKEGKRVLLERIPFIWKHLSFTWKSTIRNLFRYKKRFFMTLFGIGGCTALMLVGFGLRDSIMDVALIQYGQLQLYDGQVILDDDAKDEEKEALEEALASNTGISAYESVYMKKMTMKGSDGRMDVYLMVPETLENFEAFICTRDRATGEMFHLSDEGMILSEKAANTMGVKAGDTVTVQKDETHTAQITVAAVCEHYMYHYAYLSPAAYEKSFGEVPDYNTIIFCTSTKEQAEIESIGEELLKEAAALSISYMGSIQDRLDDMLGSLDIVIVVLIISAGMLAFVVLYNLNNINVNERKRELATLKVLGFFDKEVSAYIYRENILLTLIGAVLGIGLGMVLHQFVIRTVEVEECMFGRNVKMLSCVISVLITCAFSVFVNGIMHFKLKKIDMVESLKSVE